MSKSTYAERLAAPSITPSISDDVIHELALERLHFFEQELAKYGLHFRCGAELEFFIEDKDHKHSKMSYSDINRVRKAFKDSPYVERVHNEPDIKLSSVHKAMGLLSLYGLYDGHYITIPIGMQFAATVTDPIMMVTRELKTKKHEIVIGQGMGVKDKPKKYERTFPSSIANAIVAVKNTLVRHQHDVNAKGRRLWKGEHVNFSAMRDDKHVSAGLHMAVSVQDANGNNIFANDSNTPTDLMKHCAEAMLKVQKEGAHLMLPSEQSYRRLIKWGKPHPIRCDKTMRLNPFRGSELIICHYNNTLAKAAYNLFSPAKTVSRAATRIENRMPGADADPYLAMVATAGAVYHTIKSKLQYEPELDTIHVQPFDSALPEYTMPANQRQAYSALKKSDLMRSIMGDKLYQAVLSRDAHLEYAQISAQR